MAERATVLQFPPVPIADVADEHPTIIARAIRGIFSRYLPEPKTSPARVQNQMSNFLMLNQIAGKIGQSNAATYRAWSITSPWVRTAINIRRDQAASAEWDIVPYTIRGKPAGRVSVRLADRIRELIENPNPVDGSFQPFIQRVVEDLLVLDAAPIEKVRYPGGQIAELWPTPGDYIRVAAKWDGSDPEEPRYFWYPDGTQRASFTDEDMIYLMANPRTNSPIGIPPLEILRVTVDSELQATEYNRRQVMGAAPDGVLNIGEDATPEKVQEARSYWDSEVLGKNVLGILGGFKNPNFMKFRDTNRDMQFREWQDVLIRAIASVYGLSPMDLAITFDVNRSTAGQQNENTEDRGVRPMMALLQDAITKYVVWDKSFGGRDNNLAFRFTDLNLKETKQKADINKIALGGMAWKIINEARIDDGRDPIGDIENEGNIFNHILINTAKGIFDVTTSQYIGADDFAQASADAAISVAEAQGEIDAANADAAAENAKEVAAAAPKPVPAKPPAKGGPR